MLKEVPTGHGFLQATAGWSASGGAFGRMEAGVKPMENLGVFGFGQVDRTGPMAGVGARLVF